MLAHHSTRLTLRRLRKRPNAEKSKRSSGTGTLITFDNGSAANVEGGVVEATGEVAILIEVHHGILDLHPRDVEVRLREPIIVALHPGVKSILTSQVIAVAVDQRVDVADHPPLEDRSHNLHLAL